MSLPAAVCATFATSPATTNPARMRVTQKSFRYSDRLEQQKAKCLQRKETSKQDRTVAATVSSKKEQNSRVCEQITAGTTTKTVPRLCSRG